MADRYYRFPSYANLKSPLYMSWAVLVFGAVTIFAAAWYAIGGRKSFDPPIRKDTPDDNGWITQVGMSDVKAR